MKKNRICFTILCIIVLSSCGVNPNYIKRIQSMEEGVSSPTTIDELKTAISKYENRVEDIMLAQQSVGIWYKILATRYIDKQMYGEALSVLQKAIMYYPVNQNLYYYVGVCAGYMAKAELDFSATGNTSKKQNYLRLSESGYLTRHAGCRKTAHPSLSRGGGHVVDLDDLLERGGDRAVEIPHSWPKPA